MGNKNWKFEIGQKVALTVTGESGIVHGRCEYADSPDSFLVEYKAADGRFVCAWWPPRSLEAVA